MQSLERALQLLELVAESGGSQSLSQLAVESGLPLPTIHRLVQTLVHRGYLRQEPSRRYALGPKLIGLGDIASRMLGVWARPHLVRLAEMTGETANLAVLEGDEVVYVAQAPGRHSMRMFTEPGRRVSLHCTGVGKAMLAVMPPKRAEAILSRIDLYPNTPHTIIDCAAMLDHLNLVRQRGYAIDDGEQELGVRCVAMMVPGTPVMTAISVSGPAGRLTEEATERVVPALKSVAQMLTRELLETRAAE